MYTRNPPPSKAHAHTRTRFSTVSETAFKGKGGGWGGLRWIARACSVLQFVVRATLPPTETMIIFLQLGPDLRAQRISSLVVMCLENSKLIDDHHGHA